MQEALRSVVQTKQLRREMKTCDRAVEQVIYQMARDDVSPRRLDFVGATTASYHEELLH